MPKETAELRAGTLADRAKGSKESTIDFSQLQISPSGQVQPTVPFLLAPPPGLVPREAGQVPQTVGRISKRALTAGR